MMMMMRLVVHSRHVVSIYLVCYMMMSVLCVGIFCVVVKTWGKRKRKFYAYDICVCLGCGRFQTKCEGTCESVLIMIIKRVITTFKSWVEQILEIGFLYTESHFLVHERMTDYS